LDGNAVVQPDQPIEPTGRLAVLVSQIDCGHSTFESVGDKPGGAADTAAGVEHMLVACNAEEIDQLVGGDAAHGVEVLKRREIRGLKVGEVQTCCGECMLDVLS
jgi:hypothetical protein